MLASGPIYLSKTVLLETEWVLRFTYEFDRLTVHGAFTRLLGLDTLTAEDAASVAKAMAFYKSGMDFADALHLASCTDDVTAFATFDGKLAKRARKIEGAVSVRLLTSAGSSSTQ